MTNGLAGVGNIIYGIEEYNKRAGENRRKQKLHLVRIEDSFENFPRSVTATTTTNKSTEDRQSINNRNSSSTTEIAYHEGKKWDDYAPGLSVMVALIVFITAAGLELLAFVVVLQCFYHLKEYQKNGLTSAYRRRLQRRNSTEQLDTECQV